MVARCTRTGGFVRGIGGRQRRCRGRTDGRREGVRVSPVPFEKDAVPNPKISWSRAIVSLDIGLAGLLRSRHRCRREGGSGSGSYGVEEAAGGAEASNEDGKWSACAPWPSQARERTTARATVCRWPQQNH
jgi:hypothetical protein